MHAPERTPDDSSQELLESVHSFPGPYQIKVIGIATDDFVDRVVALTREHLVGPDDVEHRVRSTPGGRHVSITLELQLQTASQVRIIYESLGKLDGISMLL